MTFFGLMAFNEKSSTALATAEAEYIAGGVCCAQKL